MDSLKYKPRIIKIKCPGSSIESSDGVIMSFDLDDEQESGWPEIETIILGWIELASSEDICLTPMFLSYVAQIPVWLAAERLESLYEKDLVFKSIDDGIEMFCAEDPDDFNDPDDGPDGPDGGEPIPEEFDGANNEEFYPLDTRKVANEILEELIKMAGEFDRLGLTKEADKIDQIILKVASDQKASKKTYTNSKTGKKNTVRYGQKGAKVAPGTSKGDSYCARSNGIKKALPASKRNDPNTPNNLSRKKWKCSGDKSRK